MGHSGAFGHLRFMRRGDNRFKKREERKRFREVLASGWKVAW